MIHDVRTLGELKKIISIGDIVVVKLGASWCKPCALVHPLWEKLAMSGYYQSNVRWVEAEVEKDIYSFCEANRIPYFAVFKTGKLVDGIQTSDIETIRKFIDSAIDN